MELTEPLFYKDDISGVSAVVGYESHAVRAVRYCFTAPDTGASAMTLAFSANVGNGTTPERLLVGFDRATALGELTREGWVYRGELTALLLPGQLVELWIYPPDTTFGWVYWQRTGSVTFSGAAVAELTAQSGDLGTALTVTIIPYLEENRTLRCLFAGESLTILEDSPLLETVWTPPLAWASLIPGESAPARLVLSGTGGERSFEIMLTVPASVVPTVSARWQDVSGAQAVAGELVQGCSRLEVTVQAEGACGSTVESAEVLLDGVPYYGTELPAGELTLQVQVVDSRRRRAVWSERLSVMAYTPPVLEAAFSRCTEEGEPDDTGEFALVTLTGQVSWGTGIITLYLGESETVLTVEGAFSREQLLPASSARSHRLTALLTDGLRTVEVTGVLSVGYATMDFLAGGRGVALGCTATEEGFRCAMAARFSGGIWLTEGVDYGDTLPETLPEGRLFFLRMSDG